MMYVIGYGNPARGDDGLGPAFANRMVGLPRLLVSIDYQLTVDHALLVAAVEQVVFVDALIGSDKPFEFRQIAPATTYDLTSHSLCPATVLALAETLFETAPQAFELGISGAAFGDIHEGLSPQATKNLSAAETYFRKWLSLPAASAPAQGQNHA